MEAFHAVDEAVDAVVVVVVGGDRGNGGEKADGRGDQASAMPGATTARLTFSRLERPVKAFMIPQTVPKSPI